MDRSKPVVGQMMSEEELQHIAEAPALTRVQLRARWKEYIEVMQKAAMEKPAGGAGEGELKKGSGEEGGDGRARGKTDRLSTMACGDDDDEEGGGWQWDGGSDDSDEMPTLDSLDSE